MRDTGSQIKDYFDDIVVRLDAADILDPTHPVAQPSPPRLPGALVAGLAAALVLVVLGSVGMWLASSDPTIEPVSPSTTEPPVEPPPTLPEVGLDDVPAFEATVRYELGGLDGTAEGSTVDVLVSYQPPDSFRREILALDPPDMEFWRGAVGDYVATDGTFPINTGETTEEGEELGPLVWSNWESLCRAEPVPIETIGTLTTVACNAPELPLIEPWTIVVDRQTGLVLRADTELYGGDFAIPGTGLEVIDLTYEPEFTPGWFATPQPAPPVNPGEPFVYTYTETIDATVVAEVTWQDDATWRLDVISGNFGSLAPGSYQVYAGQTLFTYSAGTNEYNEERFPTMDRDLVEGNCSEDGTCTWDDVEIVCDVTPDGRILGRPVIRYDCDWPPPYTPSTTWVDDELGYVLRSSDGFEVLAIDLNPDINPALFEQICPAPDCTLVDSD